MPVNEFGVTLDRNRYAPSLFDTMPHICYSCHKIGKMERHEIFGGARRNNSKEYGLWVNLCPECHRTSPMSVHQSNTSAVRLKSMAQSLAMETYGWGMDEWKEKFFKNYLFMEEE